MWSVCTRATREHDSKGRCAGCGIHVEWEEGVMSDSTNTCLDRRIDHGGSDFALSLTSSDATLLPVLLGTLAPCMHTQVECSADAVCGHVI